MRKTGWGAGLALALMLLGAACRAAAPRAEATAVGRAVSATLTSCPTPTPPAVSTVAPTGTRPPTVTPLPTSPPVIPTVTVTASPVFSPTGQPAVAPTTCPTLQPTVQPTRQPALPPVAVWEQDITLNTYGWQEALLPTTPDDPIFPYPRLDFDALSGPTPLSYRAVFVQNEYVQVVVVPELGGRILRWTDRTTGRQLLYANSVIKPTRWGYRGWWLAIGGMEWAFPTDEHGLNEYRPWQYQLLWNGVRVWDTEDRTGMTVEVTIRLDSAYSYFTLVPRITNPTAEPQSYQFWINGMLTLSDVNAPSPDLIFIIPDDQVTVHSTGDGSLPGPGGSMSWPVYGGRDFSRYSEWRQYLGVFAHPAQADFAGAFDLGNGQGVVRVFPHTIATGLKLFCLGDLPAELWTDDGSRYVELWGGLTATFWDDWTLQPGGSVAWTEYWYPVSGIGGYNWANEVATIRLAPVGESAEVAVATTRALTGVVVLHRGGVEVQRWEVSVAPGKPFQAVSEPAAGVGDWTVQVFEGGGLVAQMGP
ncbi:MAG TPA: DUF5107 domain-containing protein [Chloroflexi bacterium]|nr:DUF5107 domain-containing protein [Chloroflexota bacterium]